MELLSGSRFDPDLPPTLRLELAKSNSKPKVRFHVCESAQ
jgi:hypothetical protein